MKIFSQFVFLLFLPSFAIRNCNKSFVFCLSLTLRLALLSALNVNIQEKGKTIWITINSLNRFSIITRNKHYFPVPSSSLGCDSRHDFSILQSKKGRRLEAQHDVCVKHFSPSRDVSKQINGLYDLCFSHIDERKFLLLLFVSRQEKNEQLFNWTFLSVTRDKKFLDGRERWKLKK